MDWLIAGAMATIGAVSVGLALREVFRTLAPDDVSDYRPCAGHWWEAELNQCSSGLTSIPQQPVNTYSNVAYVAAGLLLAFSLRTLPSYVLSLGLIYLCVASALYHATSTRWAGSLDVSGIYAVFSALSVYAFAALFGWDQAVVALMMAIAALGMGYLLRYRYGGSMAIKIGVFLGLIYLSAGLNLANDYSTSALALLIASGVGFGLAYGAWSLDKVRRFPLKRWGHGLWHVLTAAATALLVYAVHATG